MTNRLPVEVTNLDRYGSAALPWSRPRDRLAGEPAGPDIPFFLGTSRPDGRHMPPELARCGSMVTCISPADQRRARRATWR